MKIEMGKKYRFNSRDGMKGLRSVRRVVYCHSGSGLHGEKHLMLARM